MSRIPEQEELFGRQDAYARASDPETSKRAAANVDANKLEALVLQVLIKPMTTRQIAAAAGIHEWSISPRMKPLENKKLVRRAGKSVQGNRHRILWEKV